MMNWFAPLMVASGVPSAAHARTLQDSSAAAAAAQHRDIELITGRLVHFGGDLVSVAENDEVLAGLPKGQGFGGVSGFGGVE